MSMRKEDLIKKLKDEYNGCPLFENRKKGEIGIYVGKPITIKDYFRMSDYHAVIFEEDNEHFFFSGGSLKSMLDKYGEEDLRGIQIIPKEMIRTASKRDYRPFEVV